jgi:hypothetical protein
MSRSADESSVSVEAARSDRETVLFRFSDDPMVNDGAVALARAIGETPDQRGESLPLRYDADQIVLEDTSTKAIEHVDETIRSAIRTGLARTHQRSAIAYQINRALDEQGEGPEHPKWVPAPNHPFPTKLHETYPRFYDKPIGRDGLTIYEDDAAGYETIEELPFDTQQVSISEGADPRSLFKERTTYVGNPRADRVSGLLPEIAAYVDVFVAIVSGDEEAIAAVVNDPDEITRCSCCGSTSMPPGKVTAVETVGDGDESWSGTVRYNQSSNVWTANDGSPKALGQKGPNSSHSGRCVACVLAGFYHTLAGKPLFEIDPSDQTKRIVVPVGGFDELDTVRSLLDSRMAVEDSMDPDVDLRSTVGAPRTDSEGFQILGFFDAMLDEFSARVGDNPRTTEIGARIPTGVQTYVAGKNPNGGRQIDGFRSVDPGAWIYELLGFRQANAADSQDGVDEPWAYEPRDEDVEGYWPFDVLEWYARVDLGEATLEHRKDQLSNGLMDRDPDDIVTAIAEIYKRTLADEDPDMSRFRSRELHHYIGDVMNRMTAQTTNGASLDDQTRESIRDLAGTVGRAFAGPQGIGTLTRLQNASTRDAFEDALTRVGEALHKRRLEIEKERRNADDPNSVSDFYSSYDSEELDRVFEAVANHDIDYRSVQRVLVAHAFLEAQSRYSAAEYHRRTAGETGDEGGESADAGGS